MICRSTYLGSNLTHVRRCGSIYRYRMDASWGRATLARSSARLVLTRNLSKDDLSTWDHDRGVHQYVYIDIVDTGPSPLIGRFTLLDFGRTQ